MISRTKVPLNCLYYTGGRDESSPAQLQARLAGAEKYCLCVIQPGTWEGNELSFMYTRLCNKYGKSKVKNRYRRSLNKARQAGRQRDLSSSSFIKNSKPQKTFSFQYKTENS